MPYIRIWIHAVWSTKNRQPFLSKKIRKKVFAHMKENAIEKGIHIDFINGYTEHVHCLISMTANQNISKIMGLIKGESSHWINKNSLIDEHFSWQEEYFAVSIGHSQVNVVRNYIKNQEIHHQKKTFQVEYQEFIDKYGFENIMVGKI